MMKGFVLIFLGIFLTIGNGANGAEPVCPNPPSDPSWSNTRSWDEYKCENNDCKGNRLIRVISQVYGETCSLATTPGESCPSYSWSCSSFEDSPVSGSAQVLDTAPPYATCQGGGNWSTALPSFGCAGSCLKVPQNEKYYNNPEYSNRPDKNIGNANIKLPVKLDWDDVLGWEAEYGPRSYRIRAGGTEEISTQSELVPKACAFQSGKNQNWPVSACCGTDGTDCGPASNWNFTANLTPEPISPADPDWTGERGKENTPLPITLDWCNVNEAKSYQFRVYIMENGKETCHPWLVSIEEGKKTCSPWLVRWQRRGEDIERILYSDFPDEGVGFFTKSTTYKLEIRSCLDENGIDCRDYGQGWIFTTGETALPASFPLSPTNDPKGEKPVGLPLVLDWNDKSGINSYIYEITPVFGGKKIEEAAKTSQVPPLNHPELSLNTSYKWKVKSCWDYESKKCEEIFSEEWYFKTTGQPPNLVYPLSGAQGVTIPIAFDWQDVPGAKSYILKVAGDGLNLEQPVDKSEFSLEFLDFPVRQETIYSWQVKTCAWEKGACGQYANLQNFKTFRLPPPQNPSPENNGQLFTDEKYVSWANVLGAKSYQYQIKYLSLAAEEKDENCLPLVGKELFETPKTIPANADYVTLSCLGNYQWQVRSCLDKDCQETSNWSGPLSFVFLESSEAAGKGGLVPCGRTVNNPKTPWNEREPCQIKHVFLLIKTIIDFFLFRAAPIILVLLTAATGAMFYFSISAGAAAPLARVKSLWKSAGIGLGIIFFAWTIVNIVLKLVGYQIGIFGNWYQL